MQRMQERLEVIERDHAADEGAAADPVANKRRARLYEALTKAAAQRGLRPSAARPPRASANASCVLWALGRSATGTFADTLAASARFRYCNKRKEGFSAVGVSAQKLERCARGPAGGAAARPGGARPRARLTHVKPQHLVIPQSTLRTPEAFMAAAAAAGFELVVVIRRQNHLARLVSSFENRVSGWGLSGVGAPDAAAQSASDAAAQSKLDARAAAFFVTTIRTMQWEAAFLQRGVDAARRSGLTVLELDFEAVARGCCGAVRAVVAQLRLLEGAAEARGDAVPCVPLISHVASSRRDRTLEGRVGGAAALHIQAELAETPYAWMLDLTAQRWPANATAPQIAAHPDGPRPLEFLDEARQRPPRTTGPRGAASKRRLRKAHL
ncbi:hypothetical protein M885DRAFT_455407 [Pelagophyceae sp. CCMP2097]|nr:hypothetical protein M885DRAFT_455407 [Pelagophyceae sp. CCMP2097]